MTTRTLTIETHGNDSLAVLLDGIDVSFLVDTAQFDACRWACGVLEALDPAAVEAESLGHLGMGEDQHAVTRHVIAACCRALRETMNGR